MKFFGFLLFSRGDTLLSDPEIQQIDCSAGTHLYNGSCILGTYQQNIHDKFSIHSHTGGA